MTDEPTKELTPSASRGSAGRFSSPSISAEDVGRMIPQFEVFEPLGEGGIGCVFRARQRALNRNVALKILREEWADNETFIERFRREARTLGGLSHPGIVAVHDAGESCGLFYIVMEYVNGTSLRKLLEAGPVLPERALQIVDELCVALEAAHAAHIIHRDIKPGNILIDAHGRVKLCDFGLSKIHRGYTTEYTLTTPDVQMGTPAYVAPEQLDDPMNTDERADVYSLGVVVYEMLTGRKPIGSYPPASRSTGLRRKLDEVLARAMNVDPAQRYRTVNEFHTALRHVWKPRTNLRRLLPYTAIPVLALAAAAAYRPILDHLAAQKVEKEIPKKAQYFAPPTAASSAPIDADTFQDCEY